jgi:hypothetical protein
MHGDDPANFYALSHLPVVIYQYAVKATAVLLKVLTIFFNFAHYLL